MHRLFSKIPRNLSNATKNASQTFTSKTNPSQFTPEQQFFTHSHTQYVKFSNGVFSNPIFSKQMLANSSSRLFRSDPNKVFVNRAFGVLRSQLIGRRHFHSNFPFASSRRGWNSGFGRFSTDNVVLGLILSNVAVFLLWRVADNRFMMRNFMISVDNFTSGRVHTMITSAFSHIDPWHLISNMVGLYFFGSSGFVSHGAYLSLTLHGFQEISGFSRKLSYMLCLVCLYIFYEVGSVFGPEFLLKLYLSGALLGSVFYLVYHAFIAPSFQAQRRPMLSMNPSQVPGLGASGAVNAVMLLDIFMFPKKTLYFDFIIPVPAILLGIFLIGKDVMRILEGDTRISGSAHLGGAVTAAIAWARIRRGRF